MNAVTAELEQVREQLEQRGEAATPKPAEKLKSVSSGGSIIAEKVFEPLDAILKAFEARLQPKQTLEERWLTYPYAELEKQRFEMCKKLIETAQSLLEPPPEPMPERVVKIPSRTEPKE